MNAGTADGGLSRIGTLHDRDYLFLNGAAGYWVYRADGARLSGVAAQAELDYYRSFGPRDTVQWGAVGVGAVPTSVDVLNFTAGAVFEFRERTRLSVGVSIPLSGARLDDWNVTAQLNYAS